MEEHARTFTAFAGDRCLGSGSVEEAITRVKKHLDRGGAEPVLVFEDRTGSTIDFDLRGSAVEAIERLKEHPLFVEERGAERRAGPGRPKLGVVSREVSLLPRHWEWLEAQRGGISVTLRSLVEEARKRGQGKDLARKAREAAGKFMWIMAGNLPMFEEASRALYAKDDAKLETPVRRWPADVKRHTLRLVAEAARLEALAQAEAGSAK